MAERVTSEAPNRAQEARAAESRRAIAQAGRDSETLFGGLPSRLVRHFAAADADPSDKAELWGRRVGRALSLAGCLVLAAWLIVRLRGS
jgi:ferric-dicitrate binding protein FerR (iron transport regulator)